MHRAKTEITGKRSETPHAGRVLPRSRRTSTRPFPDEECHEHASNARAARSNFYYAFYLLPKPKRDGLAALYAFMRLVDDVADEGDDVADKQRGLAKWRAALDAAVTRLRRELQAYTAARRRRRPARAWSTPCAATTCPRAISTI